MRPPHARGVEPGSPVPAATGWSSVLVDPPDDNATRPAAAAASAAITPAPMSAQRFGRITLAPSEGCACGAGVGVLPIEPDGSRRARSRTFTAGAGT